MLNELLWRDISTAPKDGTDILLKNEDGKPAVGRWNSRKRGPGVSGYVQEPGWIATVFGEEVGDEGWDTGNGYSLELKPAQWMPVP